MVYKMKFDEDSYGRNSRTISCGKVEPIIPEDFRSIEDMINEGGEFMYWISRCRRKEQNQ